MGIQFKKSVLEMLILSLVNKGEATAFQLENQISNTVKIPEGSVYPVLRALTRDGYLMTQYRLDENQRNRKIYILTASGLNYHDQLQAEWSDLTSRINVLMEEDMT